MASPRSGIVIGARNIGVKLNDPDNFAKTRKARNSAGSERHAKVTSRAARHPLEWRTRIQRGGRGKEPGQTKQICEENQIAGKSDGCIKRTERDQKPRDEDGRQPQRSGRHETPMWSSC